MSGLAIPVEAAFADFAPGRRRRLSQDFDLVADLEAMPATGPHRIDELVHIPRLDADDVFSNVGNDVE